MTIEQNITLQLIRKALHPDAAIAIPPVLDWASVIDFTTQQGVLGLCFEAIELLSADQRPDMDNLMDWLGQVEYMKTCYEEHSKAISELAEFYANCGSSSSSGLSDPSACSGEPIKMMLMKGYGLSLDYPVPEHRPTGDIDIWLFGDKTRADMAVRKELGIAVDEEYQKHSHFTYKGVSVENHGKFIDDETHKSNIRFEEILMQQLDEDKSKLVKSPTPNCWLPSPTWNALFLLRHAGEHFAASEITLRHILDLGTFFVAHHKEIDWERVHRVYETEGMKRFYDAVATICVRDLGMAAVCFVGYQQVGNLADRILEDIFNPKEALAKSSGGFDTAIKKIVYACQKSKRWFDNRWKFKLIYKESMWESFWGLAWNRIKSFV